MSLVLIIATTLELKHPDNNQSNDCQPFCRTRLSLVFGVAFTLTASKESMYLMALDLQSAFFVLPSLYLFGQCTFFAMSFVCPPIVIHQATPNAYSEYKYLLPHVVGYEPGNGTTGGEARQHELSPPRNILARWFQPRSLHVSMAGSSPSTRSLLAANVCFARNGCYCRLLSFTISADSPPLFHASRYL